MQRFTSVAKMGFLCAVAISAVSSGCATMANIDQQIAITSIPDGADVKIGNMSGTTP